jgi:arylformamidase
LKLSSRLDGDYAPAGTMKIWDISRPLFNGLAPWPGDTPFQFDLKWKMAEGATVNVGAVAMGVHNGTHADAPFHFESDGRPVEQMSLEVYVGDAVVVDLTGKFKLGQMAEIQIADLESFATALAAAPRLLLKTGVWTDPKVFPASIPVLARNVPEWLGKQRVKLAGFDVPSVDPIDAKVLANHHALAAVGIAIVESLDLTGIEAGTYHFSALPLRITGADAAPVRAVLWRD